MSNPDDKEQAFLQRINKELDKSEGSLDAETLRALKLARNKAVEAHKATTLQKPWQLWQPVGAVALAATLAAVTVSLNLTQQAAIEPLSTFEDISLLGASEELELYEELEFYQWLESEGRTG